jgi:hypothetical protein
LPRPRLRLRLPLINMARTKTAEMYENPTFLQSSLNKTTH